MVPDISMGLVLRIFLYYDNIRGVEIHQQARRHGVLDADLRHAVRHHLYEGELDEDGPPWRVLYLGPDRAANLLEVVVIERDDGTELAIHAMKMQSKHVGLLPWEAIHG